jgi:UPF0755 protein
MKKLRNFMLIILVLIGVVFVLIGVSVRYYSSAVSKESKEVIFTVPENAYWNTIASSLKSSKLIKNETFFKVYVKLMKPKTLKHDKYRLNQNMDLDKIIVILSQDEDKDPDVKDYIVNDDEITITFQEGINMRRIAKIIESKTDYSYDDVMKLVSDKEYLNELINKYWFITDSILDSRIYYPLEGYLFPETYRFKKDATIKDIFTKMLDEMGKKLEPYKDKLEGNKYNIHQMLTLASMVEKEISHNFVEDRHKAARVFLNRLDKGMTLGSDVTTRYAIKLDDTRPLTAKEYQTCNAYNTRCSTFTGLPAGPISTISATSIKAAFEPAEGKYLYFVSNIKTGETFFFDNQSDFNKKVNELRSVNGGY